MKYYALFAFLLLAFPAASQNIFWVINTNIQDDLEEDKIMHTSYQAEDKIRNPAKRYIALLHKDGGTVEIFGAGRWSAKNLAEQLAKKQQAGEKYPNIVLGDESQASRLVPRTTVERCIDFIPKKIKLPLARYVKLMDKHYTLNWTRTEGDTNYVVRVANFSDEKVYQQPLQMTSLAINLDAWGEDAERWTIYIQHKKERWKRQYKMERYPALLEEIKKVLEGIDKEENQNELLKMWKKGRALEQKMFYLDAFELYSQMFALSQNPAFAKLLEFARMRSDSCGCGN